MGQIRERHVGYLSMCAINTCAEGLSDLPAWLSVLKVPIRTSALLLLHYSYITTTSLVT